YLRVRATTKKNVGRFIGRSSMQGLYSRFMGLPSFLTRRRTAVSTVTELASRSRASWKYTWIRRSRFACAAIQKASITTQSNEQVLPCQAFKHLTSRHYIQK